jgi:hypothetical protein
MLDFLLTVGRVVPTLVGIWATLTFVRQLGVIGRRLGALSRRLFAWHHRRRRKRRPRCYKPSFPAVLRKPKKRPTTFVVNLRRGPPER